MQLSRNPGILINSRWLLYRSHPSCRINKGNSRIPKGKIAWQHPGRTSTLDLDHLVTIPDHQQGTRVRATTPKRTTRHVCSANFRATGKMNAERGSMQNHPVLTQMDDPTGPVSTRWMCQHMLQKIQLQSRHYLQQWVFSTELDGKPTSSSSCHSST
jgi:hypothetical protein